MHLHIGAPPQETVRALEQAIQAALPDADVEVGGNGAHFELRVVSKAFEGKSSLEKQRLVYSAIAPLMKGDNPPVHAIDRLEALVPGAAPSAVSSGGCACASLGKKA
jgi:acid stress-induced BolA-like protein IbaG/YrbA